MIVLISGTNRRSSQSLKLTQTYQKLFETHGAATDVIDLADLPPAIFTPEAFTSKPPEFLPFSQKVLNSKGLFVVVPEYNGSYPGVLKHFIDMLPFPESFENRPVAFAGLAAGYFGALRAVEQLQMVFAYRNAFLFNERVFVPKVHEAYKPDGTFTSPLVQQLVNAQVKNFVRFCSQMHTT